MTNLLADAYQRRLAFTEEFFNKNHDKQGRFASGPSTGGKLWSGVSAYPSNRVKPTPKIKMPLTRSDYYSTRKDAELRLSIELYETNLGNGYTSRVNHAKSLFEGMMTVGEIRKGGKVVGQFVRTMQTNEAGELVVHHDELFIDPAHQGFGLADRFNAHANVGYQRLGVDHITLDAGAQIGGYAWSRQGFRFNGTDQERKTFLLQQLDRIPVQYHKPALRPHVAQLKKEVAALRKAIQAGEDVQPIHIASIGEKYARHNGYGEEGQTYPTWPGKSVLLGTHWPGVYYFDAAHPVTAAASSLEHADLRPAFRGLTTHLHASGGIEFSCDSKSCAPPPVGVGGSRRGALQPRRGTRPGYGPAALKDIRLAGVRVTYKPDYPDDHPDPGEIVWARVPFEEDSSQSKDRPVLIIGRVNGSTKLAAIQLTSQGRHRPDDFPIGSGAWDRQGRDSVLRLGRIIQVDASNYRREGSVLKREAFDHVIAALAKHHRTPIQIAASAFLAFYNHNHDPKDGEFTGAWEAHRARITSLDRETLDRVIAGGMNAAFGTAPTTVTPWPRAPRRKGEKLYDQGLVNEVLTRPPKLEKVDPRILYATQPGLVRAHAEYYMTGEYKRTGRPSADQGKLANQFPIVYVNKRGQHLLLSGHHRALAALIQGEPLDAIIVREPT